MKFLLSRTPSLFCLFVFVFIFVSCLFCIVFLSVFCCCCCCFVTKSTECEKSIFHPQEKATEKATKYYGHELRNLYPPFKRLRALCKKHAEHKIDATVLATRFQRCDVQLCVATYAIKVWRGISRLFKEMFLWPPLVWTEPKWMKNRKIKICLETILRLPFASLVHKNSLFVREKQ